MLAVRILGAVAWGLCLSAVSAIGGGAGADDAKAVAVNSAPSNGCIAVDTDSQWWSFRAYDGAAYTVTVTTGTIWDCSVSLFASDGTSILAATNTAWSTAGASIACAWQGPATRLYVRVSGFLDFTTGTYSVAVGQVMTDADGDGLPDNWETDHFHGTAQTPGGDEDGDGVSNLHEFLAGTDPADRDSWFGITNISIQADTVRVAWPASAGGVYVLERCDNLGSAGESWHEVSTWRQGMSDGSVSVTDPGGAATSSVYRVRIEY